jgi:beta-glucosidase-like glycosyl hydrolase
MYRTKLIGGGDRGAGSFNTPEHQEAALKIAEEAIVLLKNAWQPASAKQSQYEECSHHWSQRNPQAWAVQVEALR